MDIKASTITALSKLNNVNVVNNASFKMLTENCFCILKGTTEIHNMNAILGSKPNVIKEAYAALLSASAEFVRHDVSSEEVATFFSKQCNWPADKIKIYTEMYANNKQEVEISLLNVGTYLPHVTDVNWKIDYIVKSHISDQGEGPILRVSLMTEVYDETIQGKKMEYVNFSCNTQELQDLVYKLKDAVRHCQYMATEH